MGQYLYAPTQTEKWKAYVIYRCVEYIGNGQQGRGNGLAKGRRYLKKKIGCSGKAIRKTMREEERTFKNDFQKYGLNVYYYHKSIGDLIIQEIISYIRKNATDREKSELFDVVPDSDKYLEALYGHQLSCLEWIADDDYKGQGEDARKLFNKFSNIS